MQACMVYCTHSHCVHKEGVPVDMLFVGWQVLHGESSKRLAPPRNTKDRKHLQSTQSTVNRHTSQTKHQALSKGQPGKRISPINTAAVHMLLAVVHVLVLFLGDLVAAINCGVGVFVCLCLPWFVSFVPMPCCGSYDTVDKYHNCHTCLC